MNTDVTKNAIEAYDYFINAGMLGNARNADYDHILALIDFFIANNK